MANNEKIGGLEWEASVDTSKLEQSGKKVESALSGADKAAKKTADSLKKVDDSAKKASQSISFFNTTLGKSITTITGGFLGAGAITRVIGFFKDWGRAIIGSSSALTELDSKARVVFGDQFPRVEKQVAAVANEVGRARSSILQFAADLGAVIEASGISGDALGDMSVQLSRLSVDLASFHNTSDVEAFNALRSAITGELEPMKRFGVVMTQANLKAYALSKGIKGNVETMGQAQLTNLRYAYLLSNTTTAQGDAARTADSFANQSRQLKDEIKTLNEELGKSATPVLAVGLGKVATVVKDLRLFVGFLIQDIQSLLSLLGEKVTGGTFGKLVKGAVNSLPGVGLLRNVGALGGAVHDVINQRAAGTEQFGPNIDSQQLAELKAIAAARNGAGIASGSGGADAAKKAADEAQKAQDEMLKALKEEADANKERIDARREDVKPG